MDAHIFRLFIDDIMPQLMHARIEKIQEFAPGYLSISLYSARKFSLYFKFGKKDPFCFAGLQRLAGMQKPDASIMRLRKYFAGKRISAVVAQIWSRKLWLLAAGAQTGKSVWLCLDLAKGPSLHFMDPGEAPEPEPCLLPQGDPENADWRQYPALTPALRKTLALLDKPEQLALLADLEAGGGDIFIYTDNAGKIRKISAWPLPGPEPGLIEQASEDIAGSLARAGQDLVVAPLYEKMANQALEPGRRRLRHLQKLADRLEADEQRLNRMLARQADAELIRNHLWSLDGSAKQAELLLEGRKIQLEARFSIAENMERWFNAARRGKRGLAMLAERKALLNEEMQKLDAGPVQVQEKRDNPKPAPRQLPAHVAGYVSSDGLTILVGKDSRGNGTIRRMASGHDIWAHVQDGPGAHVIIRVPHPGSEVPEATLREAAQLAARKSWLNGAGSASVMFAEVRHVKPNRKAGAGNVLIDRLRNTMVVEVDPEIETRLRNAEAR